uniref:SET domain-containing protein n=2 Tax=Octactis speculum TaxID=3111310 RepID=A0A7S2BME6_9STRA|mmetsp:Transcript_24878/g.34093  ORF Transcript_24878/g.34093 Transcript_24878/m.34093 type:complete len:140 (+) Transcript_24878:123-542(+)
MSIFPSKENPMALINDYLGPYRNPSDEAKVPPPNCRYVAVMVNGWPYIFVVAIRQILKGQPLRIDYGDNFWKTHEHLEALEKKITTQWGNLTESLTSLLVVHDSTAPPPVLPPLKPVVYEKPPPQPVASDRQAQRRSKS